MALNLLSTSSAPSIATSNYHHKTHSVTIIPVYHRPLSELHIWFLIFWVHVKKTLSSMFKSWEKIGSSEERSMVEWRRKVYKWGVRGLKSGLGGNRGVGLTRVEGWGKGEQKWGWVEKDMGMEWWGWRGIGERKCKRGGEGYGGGWRRLREWDDESGGMEDRGHKSGGGGDGGGLRRIRDWNDEGGGVEEGGYGIGETCVIY